ncbi:MAG: hypothetical protein ACRDHX_06865 [Chloroflexota bacterium]
MVLLDNQAVQALGDAAHPKHRRVLSHIEVVAQRKRRAEAISLVVPTAVRVEAGWDRTAPAWTCVNSLRISDEALDAAQANIAAGIRGRSGVSVADAHLGAVLQTTASTHIAVITGDGGDMVTVAGAKAVTIRSNFALGKPLLARMDPEEHLSISSLPKKSRRSSGRRGTIGCWANI